MIGVAENDLSLHLLTQLTEVDTLHAAAGSYGHEDRCLDLAVIRGDQAGTCLTRCVCML